MKLTNVHSQLQSKLDHLQAENLQQKRELKEMKNNSLKEKETNSIVLKQMEKIKSELLFKNQGLSSLIKEISFELPNSDLKNMNSLEVLKCFKIT